MQDDETSAAPVDHNLGFVTIGRNEGDRLKVGLRAIVNLCPLAPIVYVDSGSSDDSVAFARSLGVRVVELDLSIPFTAARARNAGFNALIDSKPDLDFVQFLDGDCELQPGWMETAISTFQQNPDVAIVSGRRHERFCDASIYNELIDIEWDTPIGETKAVPGDMCVKADVFQKVGGFNNQIIAAEDDDLCLRTAELGFKILRVDASMSYHDADMHRVKQWYKRAKRCGHGYANINHLHGNRHNNYFSRQLKSTYFWGGIVPALFVASLILYPLLALLIGAAYLLIMARSCFRRWRQGDRFSIAFTYSFLIYTSKVPELFGIIQYWRNHLFKRQHQLIEYK